MTGDVGGAGATVVEAAGKLVVATGAKVLVGAGGMVIEAGAPLFAVTDGRVAGNDDPDEIAADPAECEEHAANPINANRIQKPRRPRIDKTPFAAPDLNTSAP